MNRSNIEVASKDLCIKLFELSEWGNPADGVLANYWADFDDGNGGTRWGLDDIGPYPAYDLGFILRKLPPTFDGHALSLEAGNSDWLCYYTNYACAAYADTPENAVVLLAIKLFKAGILKR